MPNPTVTSNTNSGSFTSGTAVTVSSTGTVLAGDLMVCVLTVGGATAPSALSPPDGTWTTFLATTANTGSGLIVTAVFYKKAPSPNASFSGSFSWTTTATSGSWGFFVMNLEGASLVDGTVATSQNASGTKTSPSVTPGTGLVNDTLIGCIIGAVVGTDSITQPAGMTSIINIAGSASQPFFSIANLGLASSSATGTKTWTIPTSRTCLGVSFLITQGPIWDFETPNAGNYLSAVNIGQGRQKTRAAAIMPKDDGTEFTQIKWQNAGWEIQPPQPPTRSSIVHRFAGIKHKSGFAGFRWQNMGFEPILHQPQHPRPERSGSIARGDDGTEAAFIPPPPVVTSGWGFEIQSPQPPTRPSIRQRYAGVKHKSGFAGFTWLNVGWEIQSYQPQHLRPERSGSIAHGDDGTEAAFVPPVVTTVGSGFDPTLPLFKKTFRQVFAKNEDGNEFPLINFYPTGFEVQNYQPQHLRPERFGAIAPKDDGNEFPFINWYVDGWEAILHQPNHPRPERSGALAKGDEGNENRVINFYPAGFEVQNYQPQHLRPERSGSIARSDDGTEFPLINFYPAGWEIQSPLPLLTRPSIAQRYGSTRSKLQFPVFNTWQNVGFEFVTAQPLTTRPTVGQRYPKTRGRSGFVFNPFFPVGFEAQLHNSQRPRPEKFGAIAPFEQGIEFPLVTTVVTNTWGFDPAIPLFKKTFRQVTPQAEDGTEFPLINFYPAGWAVQDPQPPHPRRERWGSLAKGDEGIEFPEINFYPVGFEVQPHQPQHPRPEKSGAIAKWEDGDEFREIVQFNFGWEIQSHQPQHPRPEKWASIAPWSNIEVQFYNFYTFGFPVQDPPPPHPRRERAGGIMPLSNIDVSFVNWQNSGWEIQSHQPQHQRPERSGALAKWEDGDEQQFTPVTVIGWGFDPTLPFFQARPHKPDASVDQGNESPFVNWYNAGFEVQSYQPQHRFFRNYDRGDDGTERQFINFYPSGFEAVLHQPQHRFFRNFDRGDEGIERQFTNFYPSGFEATLHQPQHRFFRDYDRGDDGNQYPLQTFYPAGWEIPAFEPRYNRTPSRFAGFTTTANIEQVLVNWYNAGWEVQPPPPPHLRFKNLDRGDEGIENTFSFVAPVTVNGGYEGIWPQPPHPRPERFAGLVGGDTGNESPFVGWQNIGWPIQPHQPQHPRPEKFGAIVPKDDGTEAKYVNWYNSGWEVQPPQPPHPRREKYGSLVRDLELGNEFPKVNFFPFGWEVAPYQPRHPRREQFGTLIGGDLGTESPEIRVFNFGWEVLSVQPPYPNWAKRYAATVGPWNIEAVFVFVPPVVNNAFYANPFIGAVNLGHMSTLTQDETG